MPTRQERRESERLAYRRACPYKQTKPVGADAVKMTEGAGYSINRSAGGMLLLLPEVMDKRQVFEIQVPSEIREEQITKLVEVCWTRPISVSARIEMYLVGIRFLFEFPAHPQSPQTHETPLSLPIRSA